MTANTVFYASTGPQLTLFGLDVAEAGLEKRNAVVILFQPIHRELTRFDRQPDCEQEVFIKR